MSGPEYFIPDALPMGYQCGYQPIPVHYSMPAGPAEGLFPSPPLSPQGEPQICFYWPQPMMPIPEGNIVYGVPSFLYPASPPMMLEGQQSQQESMAPCWYNDPNGFFLDPYANQSCLMPPQPELLATEAGQCAQEQSIQVSNKKKNKGKKKKTKAPLPYKTLNPILQREIFCKLCKSNGESMSVYATHSLKDDKGNVTCPVLQKYECPICKKTGSEAHTIKYCPDRVRDHQSFVYKKVLNSAGKVCTLKY